MCRRREQFEPLAEHIYSFAQSGPRLMESLESVGMRCRRSSRPPRRWGRNRDDLQDTNQRLAESLMRLPARRLRASGGAPHRVHQDLSRPHGDVARSGRFFAAVTQVTKRLEGISKSLKAGGRALNPRLPRSERQDRHRGPRTPEGRRRAPRDPGERDRRLSREDPCDPEYHARVAEQLRESATVSPSLMEG